MQTPEIRLECLKLAHRHDRSAEEVIITASAYAEWVAAGGPTTAQERPADSLTEGKPRPRR